jgi:hypothetical protein
MRPCGASDVESCQVDCTPLADSIRCPPIETLHAPRLGPPAQLSHSVRTATGSGREDHASRSQRSLIIGGTGRGPTGGSRPKLHERRHPQKRIAGPPGSDPQSGPRASLSDQLFLTGTLRLSVGETTSCSPEGASSTVLAQGCRPKPGRRAGGIQHHSNRRRTERRRREPTSRIGAASRVGLLVSTRGCPTRR